MSVVWTILVAVIMFGLLIFIHELGHFLTAKLFRVKVKEFAIGMGPTLFHFGKKETKYAVRAFPIGGFVSMEGEDEDSRDDRAFCNKPIIQRVLIVVAGAIMNVVLGFIILLVLTANTSQFGTTTIGDFRDSTTVEHESGLKVGDQIVKVNGYGVNIDSDIFFGISRIDPTGESLNDISQVKVDMTVKRDGQKVELKQINPFIKIENDDGSVLTTYAFRLNAAPKNFFTVLHQSLYNTVSYVKMVWTSLGDLITGKVSINNLMGVVGVTNEVGKAASMGWQPLMSMVALITINLGVVNLLPFPALDGGRLIFLLIEAIRRKPIKAEIEGYINMGGFVLLIGLVIFTVFSDISRIFFGG